MANTNFNPRVHGFHFDNRFQNHRFWLGGVHLNFGGRCGGMVYTALDFFKSHIPIPSTRSLPREGDVVGTYISVRQDESTLNNVDRWLELILGLPTRASTFYNWGIQNGRGQAGVLKREIDNNNPVPLGLVKYDNAIQGHHQVLAIGYEGSGEDLRIKVYDPNYPDTTKVLRPFPSRQLFGYENSDPGRGIDDAKYRTYFVDLNYRQRRPYIHIREDGADYRGKNFQGHNLSRRDFRGANATSARFVGATVTWTDFHAAKLNYANFQGANARHSSFEDAALFRAVFTGADLKNSTLVRVFAEEANFYGADLKLVDADFAHFDNVNFQGADLHKAKINCAFAQGANFRGSNLSYSKLKGLQAKKANFYGADLHNSILCKADLRKANFHGADLRNVDLRDADLTGANLHGADLRGANTGGARGFPDNIAA